MEQTQLHATFYEIILFLLQLIPVGVTIAFLWRVIKEFFDTNTRKK